MPDATVIPVLAYPDVNEAAEWLCRSFGFTERLRIGNHRVQLAFGEGAVVITGSSDSNDEEYISGHSIMVRVANIDDHFKHAQQCGVQIIAAPSDYPYGERQYTAQDLTGGYWTFSQTINDVDPVSWGGILFQ